MVILISQSSYVMNSIKAFVFTLFFFALAGCGGSSSSSGGGQATTEASSTTLSLERTIVVIGDSIGTGYGASTAFPDILQSLTGIRVVNISKGGSSAEFGASRAPALISQYRPMYLVMLLGTNNAGGAAGGVSGAVSSLQYAANVAENAGVIPIIGTLPPITRSSKENSNVAAISSGIRGISGARIAPIYGSTNGSHIGGDGKHPNNSGQDIIARLFAQQIY
jgi:lysophospholipase L1-like esterase